MPKIVHTFKHYVKYRVEVNSRVPICDGGSTYKVYTFENLVSAMSFFNEVLIELLNTGLLIDGDIGLVQLTSGDEDFQRTMVTGILKHYIE